MTAKRMIAALGSVPVRCEIGDWSESEGVVGEMDRKAGYDIRMLQRSPFVDC